MDVGGRRDNRASKGGIQKACQEHGAPYLHYRPATSFLLVFIRLIPLPNPLSERCQEISPYATPSTQNPLINQNLVSFAANRTKPAMLRLGFCSLLPSPPLHADALRRRRLEPVLPSPEPRRCAGGRRGRRSGLGTVGRNPMRAVLSVERDGRGEERKEDYDAIVIGSGIGGLVAATQLAVKGARVLVLEKYLIPGGSSGYYERDGFTFDVGSSVMFGFSDKGNLNLITQALAAVGCKMQVIPDPTTVHFHLPAYYLPQNAGDIARKFIKDPQLLSFIDAECFIVSTVNSLHTPMINASMVLCDRHFGGINYPVGGVGGIAKALANGLVERGSKILYKAYVTRIIIEHGRAVGVRLSDGREFFAKTVISNATRWDTFGKLVKVEDLPEEEKNFQRIYVKAPSFLSIHMGVKDTVVPRNTDCHHFILEDDWANLEKPYGSIFVSIPTVLDSSLASERHHILHIFTTSCIEDWKGLSRKDYEEKKELVANKIISRLENKLFPGLKSSIVLKEVGTPKTHRRFLARDNGTYGPIPRGIPKGLLGMPFNTTAIAGLYCVGDSCFPGQGVIAVAFSGIMCSHRVAADIGLEKRSPVLDAALLRLLGWLRKMA
ncbi:prolycopene isomerase 1, chloroplastic isoform X2 [Elaeis guineensis]|uniref:Prolycopene isomerase 1, chloroplastic isoform X2 n=1 Tax=Elaeis guineensis var. tenera TaxID=51953 RepID=A0A6I9QZY1_ELAGV|nr:prolycopene isomerase 1, chloroplastic isoform X2 [Elaeis guineensis]